MDLPQNLVDEFAKGRGVLFVGAGLSKGAGLPDWKTLVAPLARELGCSPDLDPTKIAQYYQNKHGLSGRNLLVQHVKRAFAIPNLAPTRNHQLLAQLPVRTIFTTNYDDLLERALADAGRAVHRIVLDKGIGYWNEDEAVQLVKMHGSLDDEETIVLTADDYAAYFRIHPNIARQLSALLMTRTFLLLGYSLSDPDFWQIYNQIRFDLGEYKRPAYAVFFNADPLQADDLCRGGIEVINLPVTPSGDYDAALAGSLTQLLKQRPRIRTRLQVVPKFFITHASDDVEFARRLCNDLRGTGLDGFFDVDSLRAGDKIALRIERGLEDCDLYIPILSPAALESPWCQMEMNTAIILSNERERKGRPRIIPVIAKECSVPVLLRGLLYIVFPGRRYEDALQELLIRGLDLPPEVPVLSEPMVQPVSPPKTPVEQLADRVARLLHATGYEVVEHAVRPPHQIYVVVRADRGSPRETRWVVACREGEIEAADVRALDRAVRDAHAARGYIVSDARVVPAATQSEASTTADRVRALTLDAFYRELVDFTRYVEHLVAEWEGDDLSRYYVDLGGERPHFDSDGREVRRDTHKPLDTYLDEWLGVFGGNHVSILGDYGTGKTTLVRQYAYKLARRYLADPERARIPILISLRAYAKAMNLRQLVTDFLVNEQRERVRLTGGYAAFEQLNRDGKFVLIFDGFDEMTRQVTYQTTVDNFNELAQAAAGRAKVLLTCRTHYFRETREARRVLAGEEMGGKMGEETSPLHFPDRRGAGGEVAKAQPAIDLSQRPGFQIVYLEPFTEADITTLLQRRFPAKWLEYDARIRSTYNLTDLAKRPVLLNMIVQTLPEWGKETVANAAGLYRVYTENWMERDIRTGKTFIGQDDKRLFSEELATEIFRSGQLKGIHFSKFPERVKRHFKLEKSEEIDYFAHDILTHSFLIRDDDGMYHFAHNSFMEFFVAQKLWRALSAGQSVIATLNEVKGKQSPTSAVEIASSQTALLAMTEPFNISEEIRAFICGLFAGKLPPFAAPRRIPEGMVYVPPGPFVMGGEVYDDEKPTRIAVLRQGFFIDRYPVTHAQYQKVRGCHAPPRSQR